MFLTAALAPPPPGLALLLPLTADPLPPLLHLSYLGGDKLRLTLLGPHVADALGDVPDLGTNPTTRLLAVWALTQAVVLAAWPGNSDNDRDDGGSGGSDNGGGGDDDDDARDDDDDDDDDGGDLINADGDNDDDRRGR